MDKEIALRMLSEYATIAYNINHPICADASGMPVRWPKDGSEKKAMRWLGYIQGVLVTVGAFTLEEVKNHSKRGWVIDTATTKKGYV